MTAVSTRGRAGAQSSTDEGEKMRILIAEDNRVDALVLQKLLQEYGACDTAADGATAVQMFTSALQGGQGYDLVCMDIGLPGMDGQNSLEAMRSVEAQHGVEPSKEFKALMITSTADVKNVCRAFFRGQVEAYVVKPVNKDALDAELKKLHF